MSNNSVIEGVKGMVVVSRCKRKSIPVIDAPLNEGGYSDWRLLIPHGYITLSEAVKRFGYGLSLKALMKIMYAAKVPTHTLHILKNEGVVTPETDVVEVFPTYRLLCLPQTAKYQYLERKDGYGSGVLIPDGGADDDDDADQNRGSPQSPLLPTTPLPTPITSLTALTLLPSLSLMPFPLEWQCRTSFMTSWNAHFIHTISRILCSRIMGMVACCTGSTCGRHGNSTRSTW